MESCSGSASHHLVPAPGSEPTEPPPSILVLPSRIRHFIWEYAIPDRKTVQLRGRFDQESGGWVIFVFRGWTRQPSLTQVCRETRQFMLRNGEFIFGKDPTEPGLWWNPKVDILLFTYKWDLRFEWNALEGLRGLEKVKNVTIDQDLARWVSYRPIYPCDLPAYDPSKIHTHSGGQPVGFRLWYPDNTPYFKFFLFNGIHPDNLSVLFTRLLQEPAKGLDNDDFPDVRVDFDFLNDDLDQVKRKLARLGSLWVQSRQNNRPDRYVINMDSLFWKTEDKPGPLFLKGASCGGDEHVDASVLKFFLDMDPGNAPLF